MTITYHEDARTELIEAIRYYRDLSKRVEAKFEAEYRAIVETIRQNPQHFHFTEDKAFRRANMKKFPFRILYDLDQVQQTVKIMVVCHERRHPSHGLNRRWE